MSKDKKHPCKACVFYREHKNGKTECKLESTGQIEQHHGFCFSKRVKNPYWDHGPYNCPYPEKSKIIRMPTSEFSIKHHQEEYKKYKKKSDQENKERILAEEEAEIDE